MVNYKKIVIVAMMLLSFSACMQRRVYTERRFLLGTVIEVTSPYKEAAAIAFEEIERIEKIFSIYKKDSVVSHLNKTGFLNTNFEVARLIEEAKKFYELSEGKFDISIGPLTEIWKEALDKKELPREREIEIALKLVGCDYIHVDKETHSIKFKKKGMKVDLGGIAKGYAVDATVKELKRKGIDSAIVNAGGNLYCLGTKFGQPWQVGLQHPRIKTQILNTLSLINKAVATSGDYEQYMEIDSKRYFHIIDPQTGYPVRNDVLSVSVIAKDAMTADALSTSIFVLGKDKGNELFKNYVGVEKIIVITKSDLQNN